MTVQQVVEIVRDAAGELADRLHLLRLAQRLLGLLALVDLAQQRLVGLAQRGGLMRQRGVGAGERRLAPRTSTAKTSAAMVSSSTMMP